jgi:hypothetical protein
MAIAMPANIPMISITRRGGIDEDVEELNWEDEITKEKSRAINRI